MLPWSVRYFGMIVLVSQKQVLWQKMLPWSARYFEKVVMVILISQKRVLWKKMLRWSARNFGHLLYCLGQPETGFVVKRSKFDQQQETPSELLVHRNSLWTNVLWRCWSTWRQVRPSLNSMDILCGIILCVVLFSFKESSSLYIIISKTINFVSFVTN